MGTIGIMVRETVRQPHGSDDDDEPEWTVAIGLRRAIVYLLIWSGMTLPLWGGFVWLMTPWFNGLSTGRGGGQADLVAIIALAFGWLAGRVLWDPMLERAGFESRVLTTAAVICISVVGAGGIIIAGLDRPLVGFRLWMTISGFVLGALVTVFGDLLSDA